MYGATKNSACGAIAMYSIALSATTTPQSMRSSWCVTASAGMSSSELTTSAATP